VSTKAPSAAGGPVESRPLSVPKGPGPIRRLPSWLKGMVVLVSAFALMFAGLRWAYGGFGHYYYLSVDLPRASQQLQVGSDVRMSGVIIGQVTQIELVNRHVRVRLQIDRQYPVPADASANVDLTTLLGAKFINVKFDAYSGPFLADGGRITSSHVGPELEDALADGVSVFEAIQPADLATIISELATGARGHGADVARGIQANTELTRLFARTLDPQLESLKDLSVVFGALRNSGTDLNELANAVNEGVPVYASEAAQRELDAALRALVPFADNLADLLILNRSDWDKLISGGDSVLGALAARPADLHRLVLGLYQYVLKLGGDPHYRANGSADAGFVNFIGGNDPQETLNQFCGAHPPEIRAIVPICGGTPK
jgi:phospholipid/cholesterol/gamma-HCH transport system substrate-binding protein